MAKKRKLITPPESPGDSLKTVWQSLASQVEDSLLDAGAIPQDDYTRMEAYRLAQPLIVEMVVAGKIKIEVAPAQRRQRRQAPSGAGSDK